MTPDQLLDTILKIKELEREYNLKYLGRIGNVFHTRDIDTAIEKGKKYDPDIVNQYALKSMGIDPAWGSSTFGIVVTHWVDKHIQILHAEEYQKPDYNEMLNVVLRLIKKFNINKIYIDGANPSFIKILKIQMDERPDYEWLTERAKKMKRRVWNMDIISVHFATEHKDILAHCKIKLEKELVAINPRFDKLIIALRTAVHTISKIGYDLEYE